MITIVCPVYNEEKYIINCIDSILNCDYPKDKMELIFVDGRSTDKTLEILNKYSEKYYFIKVLDNPKRIAPCAMNIGIQSATGDIIIRIDAHAQYPRDYISTLSSKLIELNANNVGGVCKTLPAKDTVLCKSIATIMSNGFGVGNSYFRIGISKISKVDTVPFGCFKRDLFDRIGLFDEELIRNQDDEFNGRIIKNGGTIYLLPNLIVEYYARDSVKKLHKMFYQYGLFKPLVNKKLGSPATIRQFIPLCFLIGLIMGGVLSIFFKTILAMYIGVITLYITASLYFTRKEISKEPLQIIYYPWLFAVVHLSYGWGYLQGIIRFTIRNKQSNNITINR